MTTSVEQFVSEAIARRPDLAVVVACFYAVRDLPYAIDGAHDADGLLALDRGDCLAKSDLLRRAALEIGVPARFVRWRYLLPDVVPEVAGLPSRLDVHRATQMLIDGKWVLADATHQPGLADAGLAVTDWDGRHDSVPGYPPVGPILVEGRQDAAIAEACEDVRLWLAECTEPVLAQWRSAYINWLRTYE